MTLFLTDQDVKATFSWGEAIAAIRAAYATNVDGIAYPPRTMARGDGAWLRTLSGVSEATGLMGAKQIAVNKKAPWASYLISLFDQETAELVALLDGHSITGCRTAATSAVAADLLAPATSLTVAVIGSGFEAQNHLRALASVRDIDAVRVYSPRPESRSRFVESLADLDQLTIEPRDSAQAAVAGASLIVCAARTRDGSPTILGDWLSPGVTVVSIGSTLPEQREVDPQVIRRSDLIVADMVDEVLHDTGDLIAAAADGVDVSGRIVSLADLVTGRSPGRTDREQITLYKSVGSAVQDLAVACLCLSQAQQSGLGTPLTATIRPVSK